MNIFRLEDEKCWGFFKTWPIIIDCDLHFSLVNTSETSLPLFPAWEWTEGGNCSFFVTFSLHVRLILWPVPPDYRGFSLCLSNPALHFLWECCFALNPFKVCLPFRQCPWFSGIVDPSPYTNGDSHNLIKKLQNCLYTCWLFLVF